MFCLLGTQITSIQLYQEKKPTIIYTYIGMHLHLYPGNMEHSEFWLIGPILSAPKIIIYSMNSTFSSVKYLQYGFHTKNGYPM